MANSGIIRIAFLGDLLLGGEFLTYAKNKYIDLHSPFRGIEDYLKSVDIIFLNIEGPLFMDSNDIRQGVSSILNNHNTVASYFKKFNKVIFNLGNNHIMDYGIKGLAKTKEILNRNSIYYLGAGINEGEAFKELILEVKSKKIAFLSYTSNEPNIGSVIASTKKSGCASYLNLEKIEHKITALKKEVDIICVSLHWGFEYFSYPSPRQISMAHHLSRAGANIIFGHHPHVLQPIEFYQNSLIMYSLGNFFMPPFRYTSGRKKISGLDEKKYLIISTQIDNFGRIKYSLLPGKVDRKYNLRVYKGIKYRKFCRSFEKESNILKLSDYEIFWEKYKNKRYRQLNLRQLMFAVFKFFNLRTSDLKKITFNDITRQGKRLIKMFF